MATHPLSRQRHRSLGPRGCRQVTEDPLAQAERHVREGEQRVAEQVGRLARMKADGDSERRVASAEAVLVTLRRPLNSRESIWKWNSSTVLADARGRI